MSGTGSDESFLRFYESYARSPKDHLQSIPKEPGDFRERVERDTFRLQGRKTLIYVDLPGLYNVSKFSWIFSNKNTGRQ